MKYLLWNTFCVTDDGHLWIDLLYSHVHETKNVHAGYLYNKTKLMINKPHIFLLALLIINHVLVNPLGNKRKSIYLSTINNCKVSAAMFVNCSYWQLQAPLDIISGTCYSVQVSRTGTCTYSQGQLMMLCMGGLGVTSVMCDLSTGIDYYKQYVTHRSYLLQITFSFSISSWLPDRRLL